MVADLNVDRCARVLILCLKAVHRSLGSVGPVLDVNSDVLIRGLHFLAALIRKADRIAVNVNLCDIALIAFQVVSLVLFRRHLAGLLGLLLERLIERAALCERVSGLPLALPVT